MKNKVREILRQNLHEDFHDLVLTKLHGDASNRSYFRATLDGKKSYVIMQLPSGQASSVSEEITNLGSPPVELPFINIARYLRKNGLPIPEIHHFEKQEGIVILEDLGGTTLESLVKEASPLECEKWYRKVIDLLIVFQSCRPNSECLAFQRSFDETLYNWEFDHFLEYGIESRSQTRLSPNPREEVRRFTHSISKTLSSLPSVLTHRDFQSRNLMVHQESLYLIDFQDALIGPLQYDLVALLRDSYISLDWPLVERLVDYYLLKSGRSDTRPFKKAFDWITVQRKLKDVGRFVYIDRIKKNSSFLKFIPVSLGYVREAFERQEELRPLFEILKKYVPEFKQYA